MIRLEAPLDFDKFVFEIVSPFVKRKNGETSQRVFLTVWTNENKWKMWRWKITPHFEPFLYFKRKADNKRLKEQPVDTSYDGNY